MPGATVPVAMRSMDGEIVWTVAEIELMAPDERHRLFNERVVTDVTLLPVDYLDRVRAKGQALLRAKGVGGSGES